jgi:hypothetical protein
VPSESGCDWTPLSPQPPALSPPPPTPQRARAPQLFVALADSDHLGGAPWEVPLGRLAGAASDAALARIHTGYGDAPEQARLRREGAPYVDREFPLADWIRRCAVVPPPAAAAVPPPPPAAAA